MQYDLAKYRNIAIDDNLPSMTLLFAYSTYKKEREEAANAPKNPRHIRKSRISV
jgi:hypothetical protein